MVFQIFCPGLHEILALLTSQLHPGANHKEDLVFLREVFSERSLGYLMRIHERLRQYEQQSPTPVLHSAACLAEDAVLTVHDTVAQKNFDPVLPPLPDDLDDELEEESVKIVRLVKSKEPLVYLRALFDYSPFEDKAIPCQEAGLPFLQGDILQVVSQDDHTWWQAKRVGDSNLRAGLIPSKLFQQRRLTYQLKCDTYQSPKLPSSPPYAFQNIRILQHTVFCWISASLRRSFRLNRKDRHNSSKDSQPTESEESEFLVYEEVACYQQKPSDKPRLVVLIGSLGARISELKQRAIAENPHRYGIAVPHTTRPRKSHEKEGVDYHFITKQAFETDIQSNKFVEYGEYKENQYGTSLESVRSVLAKNKMCLVDVQPEALKILRTAEFKPFVIFVKPYIPESHHSSRTSSPLGDNGHLTEKELQEMRHSAEQLEQHYGHLVDRVLVKEDSSSACAELKSILEQLEREPQWVPISWVRI
ncbi:MAGUK p55 subfamily member 3 [Bagarius yarrelli]|uniref:MAGUK p55 subfamily member 3 n=1 Tax=Bagarius yarrelli TaxID=175774 RepID=A0A556TIR4_BAGYA|nr:MAGUK p55 subfamily member 3 [Bagarius yarrelli]